MCLIEELKELLKTDGRLVSEGELLKNRIVELALKLDEDLIKLLINNDNTNNHFFKKIDDVLVFDKEKFMKFVDNKGFLPDSYTAFKNKIGLTVDGEFLSKRKEVVLSWPYKDCILEGGQEKEDERRKEIFHNKILAPDEIDRLLDPKVFTNFLRIDADGEQRVQEIKNNDNLVIRGNNLIVLHSLKKRFAGSVRLIYIDPPYNIGSDEFKYNDNFNHSTWYTFMKNRLEIARELLDSEGVIFIHIGDQELHYLKVLADDIFGRDKFIATIPRKTRSGKTDVPWKLSQDFDWLLIYTKEAPKTTQLFKRAIERRYYRSDDYPNDEWRLSDLTTQRSTKERPNSDFTLVNPKDGTEYPVNPDRCWAVTIDTVDKYIEEGKIVFPGDYDFLDIRTPAWRTFKSEEIEEHGEDFDKTYVSSDFLNKAMDDFLSSATYNKKGTDEMIELFGEKIFDYPKNELILKKIVEYATDEGDLVLDFFAGSGTTGAVAHKMNRRYILCEQMDYIHSVTIERLKKVIGKTVTEGKLMETIVEYDKGGISDDVVWKGGGDFLYFELKECNEKFIIRIKNTKSSEELIQIWDEMKEQAFLSYRLDPKLFDENVDQFLELIIDEQKKLLVECLEYNNLYVNYSEIEDEMYDISDEDKTLNKSFYRGF